MSGPATPAVGVAQVFAKITVDGDPLYLCYVGNDEGGFWFTHSLAQFDLERRLFDRPDAAQREAERLTERFAWEWEERQRRRAEQEDSDADHD